jgi:hypothetical protein
MLDYAELVAAGPIEWMGELDAAEDVAELIAEAIADAETAEDVANVLADIGQALLKALPAILPVLGGSVGGPAGAAAGAAAGGVLGAATAPRGAARRRAPGGPRPVPRITAAPASPAAGQLLAVLFRPEVLQALWAIALGRIGAREIQVAGRSVPPDAFTNLIRVLADRAGAEYRIAGVEAEGVPEYLLGLNGEPTGDIALPEERAGALWSLLEEASAPEARELEPGPFASVEELDDEWWDEW